MRPRHVLEMLDECVVHRCAAQPADERNGLRRELLRYHDPKRDATCAIKRTRIGALSSTTLRSTMNRAACVTLFARMPRTAKYPLSAASAEPGRPPKANTSMHESAAS